MEEQKIIQERKEKLISFFKTKYNYIVYVLLAILVYFSIWLRKLPMAINPATGKPGLWDITTDNWTLGPDLDPFLFLRWAKEIVANGFLADVDFMRYVPLGFHTGGELVFHAYLIAWFHKLASLFGSTSVEQSAVIFPVFVFALTVIAFFLLSRKICLDYLGELYADIAALIASIFLVVLPVMLPRTIAGIPEKESPGFFFLFLALYFFLCCWKSKTPVKQYVFALLAALTTAAMGYVWGGYIFIYLTISISLLVAFFAGQTDKNKIISVAIWIFVSYLILSQSARYPIGVFLSSLTTLLPVFVFCLMLVDYIINHTSISHKLKKIAFLEKVPSKIVSLAVTVILGCIFASLLYGPGFIFENVRDMTKPLIQPITDRLGVTVAENRQPFFSEWAGNFGPVIANGKVPIFFWLFFFGAIFLYYIIMQIFDRRDKIINTIAFSFFLFAIIFSRYSESGTLNGTNMASIGLYVIGVLALLGTLGYTYYQYYKRNDLERLKEIDFGLILVFSFFFFSIVSARGAVRLIMVLAIPASIIVAFFIVGFVKKAIATKDESTKLTFVLFAIFLIIVSAFSAYRFSQESIVTAKNYIPSIYTQQWQLAMAWVRENTPQDAVFGHWWDYGYWVQSIGNRSTVLDGGNVIVYWNYLMGRYGLTAQSYEEALPYLYAHNTTHFLIDSTDIGKYGAFSSIGSDVNYDRASFIGTFSLNPQSTQENKNSTTYVYQGGVPVDGDIIYDNGNITIMLPSNKAGLGAILVERNKAGEVLSNPTGVFVYQNKQYNVPFRYAYVDGKFYDFKDGISSGIYIFPSISVTNQGASVDQGGVALYLSNRTVMTQLARLYLYKEKNPYFKLVHSEDDFLVTQLKSQGALREDQDIVYYQGLRGPIRIWEITYPKNIKYDPIYVQTSYPDERLAQAR